jgi:hypothetical protein
MTRMTLRQHWQTRVRPIVGRARAWFDVSVGGDFHRLPWPNGLWQGWVEPSRPPLSSRRKVLSVAIAVGALGAAVALQPSIEQRRLEQLETHAHKAATDIADRVPMALKGFFTALTDRTVLAAGLPQVEAHASLAQNQTIGREGARAMLSEFFARDPDWIPFAQSLPVQAVSLDGRNLDLLAGVAGAQFQPEALITQAATLGQAQGFVPAGAALLTMGAARIRAPGVEAPAVLLLGRAITEGDLAELGRRTDFALAVVDATGRTVVRHGTAALFAAFTPSLSPSASAMFARDGRWLAQALPLAPGWHLWAVADLSAHAQAAEQAATSTRISVWCGGVLVAILTLFIGLHPTGLRRKRRADNTARSASHGASAAAAHDDRTIVQASCSDDAVNALWTVTRASPQARLAIEPTMILPAFGRYTLFSELGKGGRTRVCIAVALGAQGLRRKFVVKRWRPEPLADRARESDFLDEAKAVARLVHPNIVPVLDFGKAGAECFVATEYILGRDLGRLVARSIALDGRALAPQIVTFLARELLKALEYAHAKVDDEGEPRGIVHRNISPSNVLISARGEVRLFDFNIGGFRPNLAYVAPEQAQGLTVDARADLFSLALVLYHCLTGETLYQGAADQRVTLAARGPGADEMKRVAALPHPFGPVLARALAVDPDLRFARAADFAAALSEQTRPSPRDNTALAALMARLFADDLRQEEVAGAA